MSAVKRPHRHYLVIFPVFGGDGVVQPIQWVQLLDGIDQPGACVGAGRSGKSEGHRAPVAHRPT